MADEHLTKRKFGRALEHAQNLHGPSLLQSKEDEDDGWRKNPFSTSLRFPFADLANKRRKVVIWPPLKRGVTHCKQGVGVESLFMLRCDRSPVMLTWLD